ncbi:hypothetical protein HMPREF0083_05212 [Aneurinibacillus aneurinilyticus ATCC 12856]|uniref:Uncharacterized protein n=1 Tax=Aneurinibacillus aneurinilyticus ATCC 12856 TaxID=649747 RepID=U1Y791_ANEAE|nr:hypothetical protein HMPREF0083_05212 [Aneurinibacillus aneurinilyticus ATCC 12856]
MPLWCEAREERKQGRRGKEAPAFFPPGYRGHLPAFFSNPPILNHLNLC